jgi:hypothetical protein
MAQKLFICTNLHVNPRIIEGKPADNKFQYTKTNPRIIKKANGKPTNNESNRVMRWFIDTQTWVNDHLDMAITWKEILGPSNFPWLGLNFAPFYFTSLLVLNFGCCKLLKFFFRQIVNKTKICLFIKSTQPKFNIKDLKLTNLFFLTKYKKLIH